MSLRKAERAIGDSAVQIDPAALILFLPAHDDVLLFDDDLEVVLAEARQRSSRCGTLSAPHFSTLRADSPPPGAPSRC
jgi:hypothetical protein